MRADAKTLPIVLLVDDDPATLHEHGAALSPFAQVRVSLSGHEALDLLEARRETPDLILLDILMPGMDGFETCRRIRNLTFAREIPIIFITSLDTREEAIQALEGGALDFITKPIEINILQRKVCNHLELLSLRGQALAQARRELRDSSETIRALMSALPDVIMRFDLEGNYLFVSDNVSRVVDVQASEFIGKSLKKFGYPGRSVLEWEEALRQTISHKAPFQTEISFIAKSGPVLHEWRLVPEFTEQGFVGSVLSISRDITRERRTEERIRKGATMIEAQAGLVSVLAAGDTGFEDLAQAIHKWAMRITGSAVGFTVAIDPTSGEITHHSVAGTVTTSGCETIEASRNSLDNKGLLGVAVATRQGFFTNSPADHPAFTGLPEGHVPIFRFLAVPAVHRGQVLGQIALANPDRDFTQEDVRDITVLGNLFALAINRLLSNRDLLRAKEQTEVAMGAKNEFLTNMSHEIRTPLNGIQGMLQLMQGSDLTDELREYADFALRSCQRLTSLLTDILNITRLEAGISNTCVKPFEPRETLHAASQLFSAAAREKGIELGLLIDPALPEKLVGDEQRLKQILTNLVGNAIKFTQSGSVTIDASVLHSDREGRCRLLITVEDTGIGIPDDRLRDLFEPFSQVAQGFTRAFQGAGLGLAITKKLVHLLSGSISVSSEQGIGTEFGVCLPFAYIQAEKARVERIRAMAARNDLGLRVLIAEDDPVSRFAAARMLLRLGCVVTEVDNGSAALERLLRNDFDLILMDIQMPFLDGVQATKIIRSSPEFHDKSNIPVVAMTAYACETNQFLEAGMNLHVSKPVSIEDIVNAIVHCVATTGQPRLAGDG